MSLCLGVTSRSQKMMFNFDIVARPLLILLLISGSWYNNIHRQNYVLKQFSQDNDFFPFWYKIKFAIEGRLSTPRRIEAWVPQGCVLAPYLYTHVQLMPPQYLVLVWVCSRVIHAEPPSGATVRCGRTGRQSRRTSETKIKQNTFFFACLAMKLMCLANDVLHRPFSFVFFLTRVCLFPWAQAPLAYVCFLSIISGVMRKTVEMGKAFKGVLFCSLTMYVCQ